MWHVFRPDLANFRPDEAFAWPVVALASSFTWFFQFANLLGVGKLINAVQPTIAFGISSSDTDIALLYELALFISFTLCFCFSDVLTSGIWSDAAALEDPLLRSLVPDLLDLQLGSRAPSTLTRSKSGEYFHASKGVSISTLREEFKKYIQPFVDDVAKYGTHSMRSGAASNPACRRIPGDLLDMHAGWRCPSSKNRYIKHTMEDHLSVSKSLLL